MSNDLVVDNVCISSTSSYDKKWIELIKHVYDKLLDVLNLDMNEVCDFLLPVISSQFMKHVTKKDVLYCHKYFFVISNTFGIISINTKNNNCIKPSIDICKELVYDLINDTVKEKDDKNIRNMCLFLADQIKQLLYTHVKPDFLYNCEQCGDEVYEYMIEI